jgi:tetratricopeptide (TPR) repeat protein
MFEEALKLQKDKLGPDHPNTLVTSSNLGNAYRLAGKFEQAVPLLEDTLKRQRAKLGPDHPNTISTVAKLAVTYQSARKYDLALPLMEEALQRGKSRQGPEHPNTLVAMNNLAAVYLATGKGDQAVSLLEATLKIQTAKLGAGHPSTLASLGNLARAYQAVGKVERAIPMLEEALKISKSGLGLDHGTTIALQIGLAVMYRDTGRLEDAIRLLEEARARAGSQSAEFDRAREELVAAYEKKEDYGKSEGVLRELAADFRSRFGEEDFRTAAQLSRLVRNLLQQRKYIEAEAPCRQALAIREKNEPDGWGTFNTKSMLGGIMLGQKKFVEAEPLLLAGYEGMKQRQNKIPPTAKDRLTEAVERLVTLYHDQGKADQAAQWSRTLAATRLQ